MLTRDVSIFVSMVIALHPGLFDEACRRHPSRHAHHGDPLRRSPWSRTGRHKHTTVTTLASSA